MTLLCNSWLDIGKLIFKSVINEWNYLLTMKMLVTWILFRHKIDIPYGKVPCWRLNEQDASGHRWLAAKCQRYEYVTKIQYIDLSRPFDTIRRKSHQHVLHSFIDTDNVRIIRLLLSETNITVRIDDAMSAGNRHSTRDSLSLVLFIVYLEADLQILHGCLPKPTTSRPQHTQWGNTRWWRRLYLNWPWLRESMRSHQQHWEIPQVSN